MFQCKDLLFSNIKSIWFKLFFVLQLLNFCLPDDNSQKDEVWGQSLLQVEEIKYHSVFFMCDGRIELGIDGRCIAPPVCCREAKLSIYQLLNLPIRAHSLEMLIMTKRRRSWTLSSIIQEKLKVELLLLCIKRSH